VVETENISCLITYRKNFFLSAPIVQNKQSAGQREGTSAMGTGNGFLSTPAAGRILWRHNIPLALKRSFLPCS